MRLNQTDPNMTAASSLRTVSFNPVFSALNFLRVKYIFAQHGNYCSVLDKQGLPVVEIILFTRR